MDEEQRRWLHQGGECGKQWDEFRFLFRIPTTYRAGIWKPCSEIRFLFRLSTTCRAGFYYDFVKEGRMLPT